MSEDTKWEIVKFIVKQKDGNRRVVGTPRVRPEIGTFGKVKDYQNYFSKIGVDPHSCSREDFAKACISYYNTLCYEGFELEYDGLTA